MIDNTLVIILTFFKTFEKQKKLINKKVNIFHNLKKSFNKEKNNK